MSKPNSRKDTRIPDNWRTNGGSIDLSYHNHTLNIIVLTFPLLPRSHQHVRVIKHQTINQLPDREFFYAMNFLRTKINSSNKHLLKNITCSIDD